MKTNMAFLTADWKELTLLNFRIDPILLASTLPTGLIPDVKDGAAFASLVAFDFENIRVAGVPWPGYTRFPEFNLRVYVKCEEAGRRGVMFVKELVPSRLPALIARMAYNEPYSACPMQRIVTNHHDGSQSQTTLLSWRGRVSQVKVRVGPGTSASRAGGWADWFTQQEWGFGLAHDGSLNRYHVSHPRWLFRDLHETSHDIDRLSLYGPLWARTLREAQPDSAFHAVGSEVEVYPPVDVARPHFS